MCSLCCGLSRMPLHTERLNEKKITKPVRPSALAWIRRRRWTSVAVTLPSAVAFLIYMGFTQLSTACSIRTFFTMRNCECALLGMGPSKVGLSIDLVIQLYLE